MESQESKGRRAGVAHDKGIGKIVQRTNVQNGLSTVTTIKKKCTMQSDGKKKKKESMKYEDTHNILTILLWRGRTKRHSQRMDESSMG